MFKFIKTLFLFLLAVLLLLIIAAILIINFVQPDRFKPLISEQVAKATGRQVVFKDSIRWTFFPSIGFAIGATELSNTGNDKTPFAKIARGALDIKLLPLLYGVIQVNSVKLNDLTLNLKINQQGISNWNFIPAKPVAVTNQPVATDSARNLHIKFQEINANNVTVNYADEQKNKNYTFKVDQLTAKVDIAGDVINIAPVTANLYHGKLTAVAAINTAKKLTGYRVDLTANNIDTQSLLQDLLQQNLISGKGNLHVNLAAQDKINTLNGSVSFNVAEGSLNRININYYIELAKVLTERHKPVYPFVKEEDKRTIFNAFGGTATISNGILSNQDLVISSATFKAEGKGTINLNNQMIDYQISVKDKNGKLLAPINIEGPFDNLKLGLNTQIVQQKMIVKVQDKITDKIKKWLGK